ncbi:MAG: N-acetylmuramic acid 6-phosphate etherase [Myxococcota bacterium]
MPETPPTEAVLEATRDIDAWSVERIVETIHGEDRRAWEAVGAVLPQIGDAAEVLAVALAGGGRWFNVGAGTSGRLGTLDAAEVPPTFGLPHHRVQAIMAGGEGALVRAVEGAEDQPERAIFSLQERGLTAGDVVVAISASGHTKFTLGSLDAAHEVGARTVAITCNPGSPLAEGAEIAIVPVVGPEVIAGSTRMKGGLAQKMVLHLLSTTVMVRLGYVAGNLMTHLTPASEKLRDRGIRIVMALGGLDRESASELLADCDGNVAEASRRLASNPG